MNGATEATLQELLLIARQMNVNLEKFTTSLGGGSGAGGGAGGGLGGLASVAKFAGPAGLALGALQAAAGLVGAVFETLGNIVGKVVTGLVDTAKNLFDFAKAAAMGTAKLSDLYDSFKDLPFFIGSVAHIFAEIVRYGEGLLDSYRQLTKTGASFSGDLFKMREAAARSGLSMQEFANVIGKNSDLFATMGGNVQAGIDKFTQASGALLGPGSRFSKDLLGLGYTASDIADGLTTVMMTQGIMGKKNALTADQLAEKTHDYLTELDALAKITGQSREELEKKTKAEMEEQSFQVFMDSLTDGQKEALQKQISIAEAYGPAAVQAVKNGARGIFAPMTKEGIDFQTTSKGMYTKIAQDAYSSLRDTTLTTDQKNSILFRNLDTSGKNILQFANGLGERGLALNADMFAQQQLILKAARTAKETGVTFEQAYKNALKAQKAQETGNAASLAQAEQNIKNFGNTLMGFFVKVLEPVFTLLTGWGEGISKWLTTNDEAMKGIFDKIHGFVKDTIVPRLEAIGRWFSNTFTYLSESANSEEFWSRFKEKMGEGIQKVWEYIKPIVVSMFSALFKAMKEALKENLVGPEVTAENQASFEKQSDKNKEIMSWDERASTFLAEGIEGIMGIFSSDLAKRMAAGRIKDDTEYALKKGRLKKEDVSISGVDMPTASPEGKATGGPIRAGQYLVGEKGPELINTPSSGNVITNDNINALLSRAGEADKNITRLMDMLNIQNARMVAIMSEMADYTKRNNDALQDIAGDAFA